MTFNLIHEAWLPVRRASGKLVWIKPAEITNDINGDPVVALDFPRPDWNAAVTEFLIGLMTCALPPGGQKQWRELWLTPPSPERLAESLERLAFAFNLDCDGPRVFQDPESLEPSKKKKMAELSQLFVEAPGSETLKKNIDHFVKRSEANPYCIPYAAAALITLQTYAPSGGKGHRTSLRGGGPLTTLIQPSSEATLWQLLWANAPCLQPGEEPPLHLAHDHVAWIRIFPWLGATRASENDEVAGPDDGHPVFMSFFATPRRIRLIFEDANGHACALGGPTQNHVVRVYRTKNYGANYMGWRHPLSPYRDDRNAGYPLPLHPASGVASYRDWLGMWGAREGQHPAQCLVTWAKRAERLPGFGRRSVQTVDAFGFDMDKMKPLAWVESRVPFYAISDDKARDAFYRTARNLIGGADAAANALKYQIKIALFAVQDRDGNYKLLDTTKADEVGREQAERFWRQTEDQFRNLLQRLVERADVADEGGDLRQAWLKTIKSSALRIFDDDIAPDDAWGEDPKRLVYARSELASKFRVKYHGDKTKGLVWDALGLHPRIKPPRGGAFAGARP